MPFQSAELKRLFEQLIDLGEPISASYAARLFRNGQLAAYVESVITNSFVPITPLPPPEPPPPEPPEPPPPEPPPPVPPPGVVDITEDRMMNLPPKFTVSGSALALCAEETLMAWEERYAPPVLDTLYAYSISKGLSPQEASTLEDHYIQKFMEESRPIAHAWISGRVFTSNLTHSAYPHDIVKFEAAAALKDELNSLFTSYGEAFIDASLGDLSIANEGARLKALMLALFSVLLTWLDEIGPAADALDLAKKEWRHADVKVDEYSALWEEWAAALTAYNANKWDLDCLDREQDGINNSLDWQWDLLQVLENQKVLYENNVDQAKYGVAMFEDSVDYWQGKAGRLQQEYEDCQEAHPYEWWICYDLGIELEEAQGYLSTAQGNLDEAFTRLFIAQGDLDAVENQLRVAWGYYEDLQWELYDVLQQIQDLIGITADPDEINANVTLYANLWNEWKAKRYALARAVDSAQNTYDYTVNQRNDADDAYNDARRAFNTWCDTYPDVCATLNGEPAPVLPPEPEPPEPPPPEPPLPEPPLTAAEELLAAWRAYLAANEKLAEIEAQYGSASQEFSQQGLIVAQALSWYQYLSKQ